MVKMRQISRRYYLRQIVACWMVYSLLFFIPVRVAMAAPQGGEFQVGGSAPGADIIPGSSTTVIVGQMESIIHWDSLNTVDGESLNFGYAGGLSSAAVLNRVVGEGTLSPTQFDGLLSGADGMRIFMINPAGIVFGKTAIINVSQLVASSLKLDDEDFLNGLPYTFYDGSNENTGDVKNYADISAEVIALIGKNVINKGALVADELVVMAAGDSVFISETGGTVVVETSMGTGVPSDFVVNNDADGDGIRVGEDSDDDVARVILAAGDIWSSALVKAYSDGGSDAVATVDISAAGDVTVTDKVVAEAVGNGENDATATVTVNSGGDVQVIADGQDAKYEGYKASIQAKTSGGMTNTSEVLICADGYVTVKGEGEWFDNQDWPYGNVASIEAIAHCGYNNNADVKIGAKEGVEVLAVSGDYTEASASIAAKAQYAENTNTASTVVCTKGDIAVIGNGGYAGIGSEALDGYFNDAFTGVCAVGDVLVAAGFDPYVYDTYIQGMGGEAKIYSEAAASQDVADDSTANAETVAVSKAGSVAVADITGEGVGSAGITAEAYNAYTNTASVGVAAGADLSPAAVAAIKESGDYEGLLPPGDVMVYADGPDSDARIMSHAYGAYGEGSSNTADTVVCAPGEVSVEGYGDNSVAKIKSWARNGELNTATTQVYASDVYADVEGLYRGNGIGAWAEGSPWVHVDSQYCLTENDAVAVTDGTSTLIIDDYSKRKDCPTCPPCPCEEEEELLAPVAPLPQFQIPRVEGCPALTQAAAAELGIAKETLQVGIGNALALNPSLQPCEACASLINAAKILRDEDGSRMAAMVQAFNAMAPANAPMTPETEASIAMAFENAPEGSQYALAKEYIDAFVQYASVLDNQLGSPVGDSLAFVMGKYGAGITESNNNNVAAYVVTRLQGI
ncbi:MAG: filamentous hemagglutinin N-terminal domain-containing protein [Planctomycetota bacterium]